MFTSLVKRLFPSANGDSQPNYFYFEDNKAEEQEQQEQAVEELQDSLAAKSVSLVSPEEQHQKAFYDFLFGQPSRGEHHDELSIYITNKIEKLLQTPTHILQVLPVLPASLAKVLEQVNDREFDTEAVIALIQQEPAIAAKVTELANSSFYNHSDREITDLKSAFMLLGQDGLMQGVLNGFVNQLTPAPSVYFRQYGDKIWQHSLSTGVVAREIIAQSAYKQEAAPGYLLGLICNLGDMIIFQLLMEAFSFVHPDCQPNTYAFKNLLYENSKKLTYHIAKHWQFPPSILDALALQAKLTKSAMLQPLFIKRPVACYVYEANIISELAMRFEHGELEEAQMITAKEHLLYSREAKQHLEQLTNPEPVS